MNTDQTIDTFWRSVLDLDWKKIILRQRKESGEVYDGPGYIKQTAEGALTFKVNVIAHERVRPLGHFNAWLRGVPGTLHEPDLFYDLSAVDRHGTCWTATSRITPARLRDAPNHPCSSKLHTCCERAANLYL